MRRKKIAGRFVFDIPGARRLPHFRFSTAEIEDLANVVGAWLASHEPQAGAEKEYERIEDLHAKLQKVTRWMHLAGFPNAELRCWRPVQ